MQRASGVMLHITSLPNKYGFGCFSKEAYEFVDFLAASGQKYWQVLPFNPTNDSGSPFQSFSVFAGNPCFIDLTQFLNEEELLKIGIKKTTARNFKKEAELKLKALKVIFKRDFKPEIVEDFCRQNNYWLKDYAIFMALKDFFKGKELDVFPDEFRNYDKKAIKEFSLSHEEEINFYIFVQYLFMQQWSKLKSYANDKGIEIIGDIAFYPAGDSSDVWANREEFCFDKKNNPTGVAGVPPDYFSEDGQLWGNPIYNAKQMKENNFTWWVKRFQQANKYYDVVRIDHFRGFESFWVCDPKGTTAKTGKWVKGFGYELFEELKKHRMPKFIAEDLGVITPKVKALMDKFDLPGMKVFQFAFDGNHKNPYFPHNYDENCVAYLGTHDNNTFVGFLKECSPEILSQIKNYLTLPEESTYEKITDTIIAVMLNSRANTVILSMQDLLYLDERYRMNIPGTPEDNWKFILPKNYRKKELEKNLLALTISASRSN